ncbi:hypothetical protein [Candidatus Anaplasma sp. TIGMIC]|uniref:hypothetical protein n=1 Tax=Candidatus Anaplasma sp. TIGMIC TaxID=3020713 RepID=UPI00232E81CC|nr:hypothetical protein [Candidatus Anaplasma sp. TIGMIC]MDB1135560.1 hypothetical protein [Candidatus Anaplasma sp. TIGMIC]
MIKKAETESMGVPCGEAQHNVPPEGRRTVSINCSLHSAENREQVVSAALSSLGHKANNFSLGRAVVHVVTDSMSGFCFKYTHHTYYVVCRVLVSDGGKIHGLGVRFHITENGKFKYLGVYTLDISRLDKAGHNEFLQGKFWEHSNSTVRHVHCKGVTCSAKLIESVKLLSASLETKECNSERVICGPSANIGNSLEVVKLSRGGGIYKDVHTQH